MLQKTGGGEETVTSYTYKQKWVRRPVNSSEFKAPDAQRNHRNFVLANMENLKAQATDVTFGAYRLPAYMINAISGAMPLNVAIPAEKLYALNKESIDAARESRKRLPQSVGDAALKAPVEDTQRMVHVSGNTVLFSMSPSMPQIGDLRITFKETRPGTVSILGKVVSDTFEQYRAGNGTTVSRLVMGTHSLDNMYGDAHSSSFVMTWILRLVGTFVVIIGLGIIVAPLAVIAGVIPLLGGIVWGAAALVSTLLGLAWSLVIINMASLRFRPLIGIGILAVAGALLALMYFKRSRKAVKAEKMSSVVEMR